MESAHRHHHHKKHQIFLGTFIHSAKLDALQYMHDTAICVDKAGKIVAIEQQCDLESAKETLCQKLAWSVHDVAVTAAKEGQFFFPGFIDTHIHAPQYPNAGIFGKSTLLDWLNRYTFPMEASLASLPRARRVYGACVRRTLACGTTAAAYYATLHVAPTNLLADLCRAAGQRALVGRVCMDNRDASPAYYVDGSADESLARARACVDHARRAEPDPATALVAPVLTPRFAPSCSRDAMTRLAALARAERLPVQTHVAENAAELALVRELFPECDGYADVYDRHGLLGPRTVLGHAVHLSDAEVALVAARGAGVAHCPCSNEALTSGECPVRRLLAAGVRVGLGTDVSGGYSASVLAAARHAVLVSNHRAMPLRDGKPVPGVDDRDRLSVDEVLHLATRGGAAVLGLAERAGAFEVGLEWDAQLVGLRLVPGGDDDDDDKDLCDSQYDYDDVDDGNVDIFGWESWEDRVAKWLYTGDDRNVKKVWVRGRLVHERKSR
ncbi:guanine deaminase [Hypoxylon sp. FL1284]|nr:guanine deaminase [Hypoxylon sp. FL1284]